MAIVRKFVASNGARVTIYDDDYADASPEELERRRQEHYDVVRRIVRRAAERALAAEIAAGDGGAIGNARAH